MIDQVLAFETSCDDTSVAVVRRDGMVLGLVSADQDRAHAPFGGIVPEVAGRNHSTMILPLVERVLADNGLKWADIGGIAVTNRPGLVGSLIVGLVTAKSFALARGLPFIGINHLEGHLLAPFLRDSTYQPPEDFELPCVALAVSGGHSSLYVLHQPGRYEVLGTTRDDAAGEAFDKFAKMVGLGFPGGARVDHEARHGRVDAHAFPRALMHEETYDLSFSGVKASAARLLESWSPEQIQAGRADLCASFQEAVVDALLAKLDRATRRTGLRRAILTGGVSANSRLRARATEWAARHGIQLVIPPPRYCTDNAAMIGYAGVGRLNRGERSDLALGPSPHSWPDDFLGPSP